MNAHLYRYHPQTGADAEDIEIPPEATEQDRIELAEMRRNGATFWWQENEPGDIAAGLERYSRVERGNITFVMQVFGIEPVFHTERL